MVENSTTNQNSARTGNTEGASATIEAIGDELKPWGIATERASAAAEEVTTALRQAGGVISDTLKPAIQAAKDHPVAAAAIAAGAAAAVGGAVYAATQLGSDKAPASKPAAKSPAKASSKTSPKK